MHRRLSRAEPSPAEKERLEKKRVRHARNAFRVVGKRVSADQKQSYEYVDSKFSNMSLREAVFDENAMEALFEHFKRVDVADIRAKDEEIRTGELGEFVVFGCLVKKHSKKETKTGGKYAVWSVCNMPRGSLPDGQTPEPTVVTVLLFEEAFQHLHTQTEGCVFAFRKPSLLPPRGAGTENTRETGRAQFSGHCLRISKKEQAIFLGICKDFKLCEAGGPNLSTCGMWYDANRMTLCSRHSQLKRRKLTSGTRMDINNAERPGMSYHAVKLDLAPPLHISQLQRLDRDNYGEDVDTLDEEARRKNEKDKSLAEKLNNKRCCTQTRSQNKSLLKRPRAISNPSRKDISNIVPKVQAQSSSDPTKCSTGTRKKAPTLQQKCQKAIDVLLGCGYILHCDGSLTPPKPNSQKPTVDVRLEASNLYGISRCTSTKAEEKNDDAIVEATEKQSSGKEDAQDSRDREGHELGDKEEDREGEQNGALRKSTGERTKTNENTGVDNNEGIEGGMVELSDESEED